MCLESAFTNSDEEILGVLKYRKLG